MHDLGRLLDGYKKQIYEQFGERELFAYFKVRDALSVLLMHLDDFDDACTRHDIRL